MANSHLWSVKKSKALHIGIKTEMNGANTFSVEVAQSIVP